MGLYKRGKWFHCNYTVHYPDGRAVRVRQPLHTKKKTHADKKLRKILNSIDDGSYFAEPKTVPGIKEVIERYVREVSLAKRSHHRNQEIAANWHFFFDSVDFFEDEFSNQKKDADKLCEALAREYGISKEGHSENCVDWLNQVLQMPDLYVRVIAKKRKLAAEEEVRDLRGQLGEIGNASFEDLSADRRQTLKRLNRLLIGLAHQQETPRDPLGGECPVSAVTKAMLSTYKSRRLLGKIVHGRGKGKVAGASTVKKELSFLRAVFNYAVDEWDDDWEGYFRDFVNPVKKVIKRLEHEERNRVITPEEAEALRKTLPAWLKPIVIVASQTGYRRANVVQLQISEVLFDRNVISISGKRMKAKNPSVKKMTKLVRATIDAAVGKRKAGFVFVDENGEPYSLNRVSVAFGRACKAAGVKDLRFHDLKHDFGTLLAENDVEGFKRQYLLDHSDPRMAGKYAHWSPSMLDAIDAIEGKGLGTILSRDGE